MTHQENISFIEFCVDMNETKNCRLEIEENPRNLKAEAAFVLIFMSYYGWFLGNIHFEEVDTFLEM